MFLVKETHSQRELVAKVESAEEVREDGVILLWIEAKAMYKIREARIAPQVQYVAPWTDEQTGSSLRILVMDRLGQNLE